MKATMATLDGHPGRSNEDFAGTVPNGAVLVDGAARLVEPFAVAGWPSVMAGLAADGPRALIDRVRAEEARRSHPTDNATAVHCTGLA